MSERRQKERRASGVGVKSFLERRGISGRRKYEDRRIDERRKHERREA